MATPTFVDKSAFAAAASYTVSVGAVPNVVADDLIILIVENTSSNTATQVNTPSGYTIAPSSPRYSTPEGSGTCISVFYKFATGNDSSDTVSLVNTSADHIVAAKLAFRNVDKTSPFNANSGVIRASTNQAVFPGVTTTVGGCLILLACATGTDSANTNNLSTYSNSNLSSITEIFDQGTDLGGGGAIVAVTGFQEMSGSTGDTTAASSFSPARGYVTLALTPTSATGTLNASESGSDVFASDGGIPISGSFSTAESGTDTFSSSGDVFVSGSASVIETESDTFAASGGFIATGSLAAQETGPDIASINGDVFVSGTLTATETGNDIFYAVGAGIVVSSGSLDAIETVSDTFYATGQAVVTGYKLYIGSSPVLSGGSSFSKIYLGNIQVF